MTHPGQLLKQANLYAGKELGQNFLCDSGTAESIVDKTGIDANSHVLEIGPGLGALTAPIARRTKNLTAVEKDSRLVGLLSSQLEEQGLGFVTIVNQDILKTDIREIAAGEELVVISNLPYNISSQVLLKLIENKVCIEKAFLMFQKELAVRIMAAPGGRDYSRLSAVAQYAAKVSWCTDIGPRAFFPRPDVDSTILGFEFYRETGFDADQEKILFRMVKAAFSKRRKTLKNSLAHPELGLDKKGTGPLLTAAGIDPARRAETLDVEEFKALTRAYVNLNRG